MKIESIQSRQQGHHQCPSLELSLTNICIGDIWFLLSSEHGNGAVSLRRKHIYQGVGVLVESHRGVGLK